MDLNFAAAIAARLGPGAAFTIANEARAPGDYLFESLLPTRLKATYEARAGNMTVRSTMAGLVGMDSEYPPTGMVEASSFNEKIAKIANKVTLKEETKRELRAYLQAIQNDPTLSTSDVMLTEALNFLNKVVIQPHLDTEEWMRGKALFTGRLDWTFNDKVLAVDYGIQAGNMLANRAGTDGYGGSTSKFWTDIRAQNVALKNNVRARILHPDTLELILANSVNSLEITDQNGRNVTVRRFVSQNSTNVASSDRRDTVSLITYETEGEMINPAAPNTTITIPFTPRGRILAVGTNNGTGYRVGEGSTPNPDNNLELGYSHQGPTEEGKGKMGRWAELDTPAERPWEDRGRAAGNFLPVIEAFRKISVASTDMS